MIKTATPQQILEVGPAIHRQTRLQFTQPEFDLVSMDKVVLSIKEDFCYQKSRKNKHYQEPTIHSIRAHITKWVGQGKVDSQVIRVRYKNRGTTRVVNPDKVRLLFLSMPNYDLKVNQPGWRGPKKDYRGGRETKQAGFWMKILQLIRRIFSA